MPIRLFEPETLPGPPMSLAAGRVGIAGDDRVVKRDGARK